MRHRDWMREALVLARQAAQRGDVPVGAVAVLAGRVVGAAANEKEAAQDPTAHAEILALQRAAATIGSWRLTDVTLYVTLEPCPMCAGAILQARLGCLVYGASDYKGGGVDSVLRILHPNLWNHRVEVVAGVLEDECRFLLKDFFALKRQ